MSKPPPASEANLTADQLAAAAADMASVLDREPHLSDFGFGAPDRRPAGERAAFERENRETIRAPRSLAQFMAARAWLRRFRKIRKLSPPGSSYGLKHRAEYDIGYITNGVFIAAAIAEGFKVERIRSSPNAQLNISALAWRRRGYTVSGYVNDWEGPEGQPAYVSPSHNPPTQAVTSVTTLTVL